MPRPRPSAIWFADVPERKPRLSRERITRAAVELLDVEGVDGSLLARGHRDAPEAHPRAPAQLR